MTAEYIDPSLLSSETRSMWLDRRVSAIRAARDDGDRDENASTETFASDMREAEQALETAASALQEAGEVISASRPEFRVIVDTFRSHSDESHWPGVLIAGSDGTDFDFLATALRQSGLRPRPSPDLEGTDTAGSLELFGLIHVAIPPDSRAVEALARHESVGAIYDADAEHSLPNPVPTDDVGTELHESRHMIWPVEAPLPPNLPRAGTGIRVAIVDSGVDQSHPDLKGRVVQAADFTGEGDVKDRCGHGTHCAGIVAGDGSSSGGQVRGIAPHVQLLSAKVLNRNGRGQTSGILNGLRWAHDQGADVISMSIGSSGLTDGRSALSRACTVLAGRGIAVCISAGNEGPSSGTLSIPADAPGAIAVGAVDKLGKIASFSSRGPTADSRFTGHKPDVVAPGVTIWSCRSADSNLEGEGPEGRYTAMSGTSMAAPHVSGTVATFLSFAKHLGIAIGVELLVDLLVSGVIPLDAEYAPVYGRGLINVPAGLMAIHEMRFEGSQAPDRQTAASPAHYEPMGRTPEMAAALEESPVASLSIQTPAECGVCGVRIETQLGIAGTCAADGCGRPICQRCARLAASPLCTAHGRVS